MEGAALADIAFHPDMSTHHHCEPGDNRQAQPGASILACGRGIGLREGLEDELLLVSRNSNPCVRHSEMQQGSTFFSTLQAYTQLDFTLLGELDRKRVV